MNTIELDINHYENETVFWNEVSNILKMLTKNKYECSIRYDDCGIYVIEFDFDRNSGIGNKELMWITEDERMMIIDNRYEKT